MKGSISKRCPCPVERDSKGRKKACRKSHGSWSFVGDLGHDPTTGKRRQVRKSGFRTADEAEAALALFLADHANGLTAHDGRINVGAYLRDWLEQKTEAGTRATTLREYRRHVDTYLIPHLGRHRLGDLRATHIERMLREIAKPIPAVPDGQRVGNGQHRAARTLSATSIRRVHATLRSALTSAKKKHLVPFNAAESVELPKATKKKVQPWSPEELGRFLDAVGGDRLAALFEVAALSGLRRGEVCGLRWDDVDLVNRTLVVRQQIVDVASAGVECPYCGGEHRSFRFGSPKTAAGDHRVVDIDEHTTGVLLAHRLTQDAERTQWGVLYVDHGLVFAREDGNPIPPPTVADRFHAVSDKLGLRRVRLHDLRHGAASMALAAGVPIATVSKRLGHSSIGITADTYSHLLTGVGAEAAERTAALVPRKRDHQDVCDQSVTS